MDTNSDSYSLHSLSIPPSLRSATKEKFDNLLKTALKHKKSTSKEKLIDDVESTTASSENLLDNGDNIQSTNIDEESNKTFLLNKFLGDSSIRINENHNSSVFKTPPVPKPRKLKNIEQRRSSNSSAHTFNVTSPKIIKNAESISSSVTYIVENEQKAKANLKEVGDVVLHNSPTISKVCVYAENRENLEKNDDSISDCNSSSSNIASFIRNSQKIDTEKTKNENIELNILSSNTDSNNEFSINKKPKPRQRLNKSKAAIVNTLPIEETVKKDSSSDVQIIEEELQPENPYNYKDITEIIIHKSDRLKLNTFVLHPVVKLHIVDIKTGEYYKKSDKKRPVVFYYESDTSYILPVMTSYYNLQEKR